MGNKVTALSLVLLAVIIVFSGCAGVTTTPDTGYITYEIKVNDIRLTRCNHPLFTFEYPGVLVLADLNKNPHGGLYYNRSEVVFSCYRTDTPYRTLDVTIYERTPSNWDNANDFLNRLISHPNEPGENITKTLKKVLISGIEADYLETYQYPMISASEYINKWVIFDYAGMIWTINMKTLSTYPEPPEIQESFYHILSTFKILDMNYDNSHPGNELNITVDYTDGVFTITNKEDFTLCGVKLFLNYTDNDLSTGYQCSDIVGIPSGQPRWVQDRELENIDGQSFSRWSGKPLKLLVQAEFPGCNNKVYSYLKTWE